MFKWLYLYLFCKYNDSFSFIIAFCKLFNGKF